MAKDTGGPVFPQPTAIAAGLTLRDLFAIAALNGVMRIATAKAAAGQGATDDKDLADQAYKLADEMMIARVP